MRDLISNTQSVLLAHAALSGVTPLASGWFDTQGFNGLSIEVQTGAVTDAGTAAGFTGTMQHSDTTAALDAVDITAAESTDKATISVTVTSDAADNVIAGVIGYNGNKRYVRINYVGTTGTDAIVRTLGRGGMPSKAPTTYIGAPVAAT